jgi:hypothetical protein
MPLGALLYFVSPVFFAIAMALVALATVVGLLRRLKIPALGVILAIMGMLCLAVAAGEPVWRRPQRRGVVVMVDLSPSTRGANFRDSGFLSRRIHELLGDTPFQVFAFASDNRPISLDAPLVEIPADSTRFSPPPADAILLFSDARFDLPQSSPPTFIVADSRLENVADASIARLEYADQKISATISNSGANTGPARFATFRGVAGPTTAPVAPGRIVVTLPIREAETAAGVELNPGDLWPENDSMALPIATPYASEKWWVGSIAPKFPGWRWIAPGQLPQDISQYLSPAIVVLANVSADQLGETGTESVSQYVRDLGGSMLILGGDASFGAGNYPGTPLETLSPLSSTPPDPTTRWILLADASGSMADDAGGISRFTAATGAMVRLLGQLPPNDPVAVGQFSDQLRWWSTDKTAGATAKLSLPPADASPHGPTNLESALNRIAADSDAQLPAELLVLSDCDTQIEKPAELIDALKGKKIRLHVMALAHGSGLGAIQKIAESTGGNLLEQLDTKQWIESARKLSQAGQPSRWIQTPATVQFQNDAKSIAGQTALSWDRTWLKRDAQLLATAADQSPPAPMAARWLVGRGTVVAVAFSPGDSRTQALADLIARKPRDPRLTVQWETGRNLSASIDAVDQGKSLNDLNFSLEIAGRISSPPEIKRDVPLISPGRYAVSIPAPARPGIATLLGPGGRIVDRIAVAGRYPPEFEALGNDHESMRRLADRSGGAVVPADDHRAIEIPWPRRDVRVTDWFCAIGGALILLGLTRWRAGKN